MPPFWLPGSSSFTPLLCCTLHWSPPKTDLLVAVGRPASGAGASILAHIKRRLALFPKSLSKHLLASLLSKLFLPCASGSVTRRGHEGTMTFFDHLWGEWLLGVTQYPPQFLFYQREKITIITCRKCPIGEQISRYSLFRT